ncbi:MAG: pyrroline-5-carboxylate reductase [Firmicutes bacterium]|nr:pyrroline-5-carboxylate reductase [Bacillota bacterium]
MKGLIGFAYVDPSNIVASDASCERLASISNDLGVTAVPSNIEVARQADALFLAVKPQVISGVLLELRGMIRPGSIIVTLAAGIELNYVETMLGEEVKVMRIMPNTPCSLGAGAIAFCLGKHIDAADAGWLLELLRKMAVVVEIDESLMNSVTALSGSGPGFVYTVIEALADGGVRIGFRKDQALILAAQTVLGAAKMVLETGEHPAKLRDMVTSPGGTTIAGLHAMERGGVRGALMDAVVAAAERAGSLGSTSTKKAQRGNEKTTE